MSKLFKLNNSTFDHVAQQRFADDHYEHHLENWLYSNPHLISDDLMIIGRQVQTDNDKRIDLLGLDKSGNAVIIELKRGANPRDLVGQISEYITAVEKWDQLDLELRTNRKPRTLDKEFCEQFKCEAPTEFNTQPKAIVVVESIDDMTRSTFKRLHIRVVTFSYLKNSKEEEYILVSADTANESISVLESDKRLRNRSNADNLHDFDVLFETFVQEVKKRLPKALTTLHNTVAHRKKDQWIRFHWGPMNRHVGLWAKRDNNGQEMSVYFCNHKHDHDVVDILSRNANKLRKTLKLNDSDCFDPTQRIPIDKNVAEKDASATIALFISELKPLLGDRL